MASWIPEDDTAAPQAPAKAWVAEEAAPAGAGGLWEGAKDVARIGSNTLTFGMMDRVRGALEAYQTGKPYGQAVDEAVKRSEQSRANVGPFMSSVGDIIGGGAAGAGLVKSGVTFGTRAAEPLLKRITTAGTEAALHGAVQGAGHTYSGELPDYIKNATIGGVLGGVTGVALPAVGAGASAAYRGVSDKFSGIPTPVLRAGQADAATLRDLTTRLGPDAMLPDAGPSMRATAEAAMQGIGDNRTKIVNALKARDDATVPRLQADRTAALGPAPRVSQIENAIDTQRQLINANDYAPVLQGRQIPPQAASSTVQALNDLGRTSRVDMSGPVQALTLPGSASLPDLSAQSWMAARQNIDSQINVARRAGDNYRTSVLTDARNLVDKELANIPGLKAADAKFAANRAELEALERGGTMLDKGKNAVHPDDLRDVMRVAPPTVNIRMRQGAHADLERKLGTQANDLNELEKTLGTPGDWNSQKLRELFGQRQAQAVADSVARNRHFRETYAGTVQGSPTAPRIAAREDAKLTPTKLEQQTLFGTLVAKPAGAAIDTLREASRQQQRDRIAQLMAERDPNVIAQLRDRILGQNTTMARQLPTVNRYSQAAIGGGVNAALPALYVDEEEKR